MRAGQIANLGQFSETYIWTDFFPVTVKLERFIFGSSSDVTLFRQREKRRVLLIVSDIWFIFRGGYVIS